MENKTGPGQDHNPEDRKQYDRNSRDNKAVRFEGDRDRANSQDGSENDHHDDGGYLNPGLCNCRHRPTCKYYSHSRYTINRYQRQISPGSCSCCCCHIPSHDLRRSCSNSARDCTNYSKYNKCQRSSRDLETNSHGGVNRTFNHGSHYHHHHRHHFDHSHQSSCSPNKVAHSFAFQSPPSYEKHTHFTEYTGCRANPNEVSVSEIHSCAPKWSESGFNNRLDVYHPRFNCADSPTKSLVSAVVPRDKYPEFVDVSPPKFSPLKGSQRYYPLEHPAHIANLEEAEARRKALEDEIRIREEERKLRWMDEDREREARRRQDELDRLKREKELQARRDQEERERRDRQRKEDDRRAKERADREREQREKQDRDRREKEQRDRDLEEKKRQTDEAIKKKMKEDLEEANKYNKMMPKSYDAPIPEVAAVKPKEPKKKKSRSRSKRKRINLRKRPDEPSEAYHMEKDPNDLDPRYEKIGQALFLNQKFKHQRPKRERAVSAKPTTAKVSAEFKNISEEEYLKTLYPDIDFSVLDMHCSKSHYKEWYGDFVKKVFERCNEMKYNIFLQRCIKTSPYHNNGGEKFAMLKWMARERSKSGKRSYERNTIASLAKSLN